MHEYEAEWHGSEWALCLGYWTLKRDGEDITKAIPEERLNEDMNTLGTYSYWYFNDWNEKWKDYEDGLGSKEWIEENDYWISGICDDYDDKIRLYEAFQADDFRPNSCGGCI